MLWGREDSKHSMVSRFDVGSGFPVLLYVTYCMSALRLTLPLRCSFQTMMFLFVGYDGDDGEYLLKCGPTSV